MNPDDKLERFIREFTLPGTRETDSRILDDALKTFEQSGPSRPFQLHQTLQNWKVKAVAAVIAMALLIPLGYGTTRMIRTLLIKQAVGQAERQIDFKLDKSLYLGLVLGSAQEEEVVWLNTIQFFLEQGQLRGTLRARARSWPEFKWSTRIVLQDEQGAALAAVEPVHTNGGVRLGDSERGSEFKHTYHFLLDKADPELLGQVRSVLIQCQPAPEKATVTPQAWLESAVLDVVYGRVTFSDGRPIKNAEVQIREAPKENQRSFDAQDVLTDRQGIYCFDAIKWPYRVGVLVYPPRPPGHGTYHQYTHLTRILRGSNEIDFVLEDFPTGSAGFTWQLRDGDGAPVTGFQCNVSRHIDWQDTSKASQSQFGYRTRVSDPQGRFEIGGLPPGAYRITVIPITGGQNGASDFMNMREAMYTLAEGEVKDLSNALNVERTWYGRLLFEDGQPAVLAGTETRVFIVDKDDVGFVPLTVDANGLFTVSDEMLPRATSEAHWLSVVIKTMRGSSNEIHRIRLSDGLLSMDEETAGVIHLERPSLYHGQILYKNGQPANPPVLPWPHAQVRLRLRRPRGDSPQRAVDRALGSIDAQGYFSVFLTEDQFKTLDAGVMTMEIMHPSYESERSSYPIGAFPANLLTRDRESAKGYILFYDDVPPELRSLERVLNAHDRLKKLAAMIQAWHVDHGEGEPTDLNQLRAYCNEQTLGWILENTVYQPKGDLEIKTGVFVIAYDKNLLETIKGTLVLLSDHTIEFLPQRKLGVIHSE